MASLLALTLIATLLPAIGAASVANASTASDNELRRLYQEAYNRAPDSGGFNYWKGVVATDCRNGLQSAQANFASGTEFVNRVSGTSNRVSAMYRIILNRNADAGGKNYWVGRINTGLSLASAASSIAASSEAKNRRNSICGTTSPPTPTPPPTPPPTQGCVVLRGGAPTTAVIRGVLTVKHRQSIKRGSYAPTTPTIDEFTYSYGTVSITSATCSYANGNRELVNPYVSSVVPRGDANPQPGRSSQYMVVDEIDRVGLTAKIRFVNCSRGAAWYVLGTAAGLAPIPSALTGVGKWVLKGAKAVLKFLRTSDQVACSKTQQITVGITINSSGTMYDRATTTDSGWGNYRSTHYTSPRAIVYNSDRDIFKTN